VTGSSDARRVFVTALLVYAAFVNPAVQNSMTWNYLDAAVSLVDTGRWQVTHGALYGFQDTATVDGRVVSGFPPGLPVLVAPIYVLWRLLAGPIDTAAGFTALNTASVLLLSAPASALAAVQVARLAGWLGASRGGRLGAALLFAFGTQAFAFGTMLFKENVAALAVIAATCLAVEPGGALRRGAAGAIAGAAATLLQSAAVLAPLLLLVVATREGVRRAAAFAAGCAPPALALAAFNTWLFGRPWRTSYFFLTGIERPRFAWPHADVLGALVIGPSSGVLLYAPFLLLGAIGMAVAWRARRAEVLVALAVGVALLLAAASWISQAPGPSSYATGLGTRYLFPAVPLLAAFAAVGLERAPRRLAFVLGAISVACGYLSAQAGFIPGGDVLAYAIKTCVSGTGMGPLFKEALPAWLGIETLHTLVSRPDVSAADLVRVLPTGPGLRLIGNQLALFCLNACVVGAVALLVWRSWRGAPLVEPACAS
jgi:hypothetical protein